jgi:hypothetical protein
MPKFQAWPDDAVDLTPIQVGSLYRGGFAGCFPCPEDVEHIRSLDDGLFSDAAHDYGLAGSGEGKLSTPFMSVLKFSREKYSVAQKTGDCVSHGTRNALDVSRAVEIDIKGEPEEWIEDAATETIYWGRGHNGQGASCSTLAKFVSSRGGILLRLEYPELGLDLRTYNWRTGAAGSSGPPEKVLAEMRKHQVQTVSHIDPRNDPLAQARDALANGYGINCCSGYGFSSRRDEDGISRRSGSWSHAMAWTAVDDREETKRKHGGPLFLIQNSWGPNWISGPKANGQPEGSFWVRHTDALGILKSGGSFVLSNIRGFPARKLPDYGSGYW